jgi:hypothetical protein
VVHAIQGLGLYDMLGGDRMKGDVRARDVYALAIQTPRPLDTPALFVSVLGRELAWKVAIRNTHYNREG